MHEIRSSVVHGERRSALASKAGRRRAAEAGEASLGSIKVKREESRRVDQRREPRKLGVIENAMVRCEGRLHRAKVHNVSSRGAMIESDLVPAIGERVGIAFAGCTPTSCRVRWVRDGRLGLEFEKETLILVAGEQTPVGGRREGETATVALRQSRSPRQSLLLRADLHSPVGTMPVKLRNISVDGVMIQGTNDLDRNLEVVLEFPDGPSISGRVKWSRARQIGIAFDEPLDLDSIARAPAASPRGPASTFVRPDFLHDDGEWAARERPMSADDL